MQRAREVCRSRSDKQDIHFQGLSFDGHSYSGSQKSERSSRSEVREHTFLRVRLILPTSDLRPLTLAFGFHLCDLGGQGGDDLEEIADYSIVGDVEDRCFGVLVDRDDRLRILHADHVLDRS